MYSALEQAPWILALYKCIIIIIIITISLELAPECHMTRNPGYVNNRHHEVFHHTVIHLGPNFAINSEGKGYGWHSLTFY